MPSDMKERIAREFAELARTKSIDKITKIHILLIKKGV